jgi:hypothetical protein
MTWLNNGAGTITEWAVEYLYADGEHRYFTDMFDEAEARREAEIADLEAARVEKPTEASVISARAVRRQVTCSAWEAA